MYKFQGVEVGSVEEFEVLIDQLNTDIEFSNYFSRDKEKEELLDKRELVKRYKQIVKRDKAKEFKEKYECHYCFYYAKPRRCFATEVCPLEKGIQIKEKSRNKKPRCPKDKIGNCSLGNEVGTCFFFCYKDIL